MFSKQFVLAFLAIAHATAWANEPAATVTSLVTPVVGRDVAEPAITPTTLATQIIGRDSLPSSSSPTYAKCSPTPTLVGQGNKHNNWHHKLVDVRIAGSNRDPFKHDVNEGWLRDPSKPLPPGVNPWWISDFKKETTDRIGVPWKDSAECLRDTPDKQTCLYVRVPLSAYTVGFHNQCNMQDEQRVYYSPLKDQSSAYYYCSTDSNCQQAEHIELEDHVNIPY